MSLPSFRSPASRCSSLALVAFALAFVAPGARASDRGNPHHAKLRPILSFHTMYGVDGPFVGDAFPVDGIPGDELPWEIRQANGVLFSNGRLVMRVRGLVFKDDPSVPPDLRGKNDETEFRAAVGCLTEDGDQVTQSNAVSAGSPTGETGDARFVVQLELPNPCVGPRVFVLAGSEDKWFAVTGFEADEGE